MKHFNCRLAASCGVVGRKHSERKRGWRARRAQRELQALGGTPEPQSPDASGQVRPPARVEVAW